MGRTVLVVDDDPNILEIVAVALEEAGYAVERAADGATALSLVDEREIDLVLADVVMPGLDGIGLARRLQERGQEAPVILMSAAAIRIDPLLTPFLAKPFDLDHLIDLVDRSLADPTV